MALSLDDRSRSPVVVASIDDGKANALDLATIVGIHEVVGDLGDHQALVLTGRDGMFSGGLDLGVLAAGGQAADELLATMGRLLVAMLRSRRPIVVAADGHAVAAGAMLMLAADHAVVSDRSANYGFAEVPNGMPLPTGVVELIAERAAPTAALRLAAHGHLAGPVEAVELGLADRVVAADDLIDVSVEAASGLAALPVEAYAETKRRVTRRLVERMSAT